MPVLVCTWYFCLEEQKLRIYKQGLHFEGTCLGKFDPKIYRTRHYGGSDQNDEIRWIHKKEYLKSKKFQLAMMKRLNSEKNKALLSSHFYQNKSFTALPYQ